MTAIEIIATVFGVLCVVLTIRQNIWCWPAGLVQVVLFVWIFYQARLYSDMGLHVIYIVLSIYGWWVWARGGPRDSNLPVTAMPLAQRGAWIAAGLVGTAVLGFLMHRYTDASLPYWDALTAVLSLIAQYLMARKKLESWAFWIAVDVVAIGVYIAKDLYVTSLLYTIFLGLAIAGWMAWTRSYRQIRANVPVVG